MANRCTKCGHIFYWHFSNGCHVKKCECKVDYEDMLKGIKI